MDEPYPVLENIFLCCGSFSSLCRAGADILSSSLLYNKFQQSLFSYSIDGTECDTYFTTLALHVLFICWIYLKRIGFCPPYIQRRAFTSVTQWQNWDFVDLFTILVLCECFPMYCDTIWWSFWNKKTPIWGTRGYVNLYSTVEARRFGAFNKLGSCNLCWLLIAYSLIAPTHVLHQIWQPPLGIVIHQAFILENHLLQRDSVKHVCTVLQSTALNPTNSFTPFYRCKPQ